MNAIFEFSKQISEISITSDLQAKFLNTIKHFQPDLHQPLSYKLLHRLLYYWASLSSCKVTVKELSHQSSQGLTWESCVLEQVVKTYIQVSAACLALSSQAQPEFFWCLWRPHCLPFVLCIAFIREPTAIFPRCVACAKGIHSTSAQALKIKDPNYSQICVHG